MLNTMTMNWVFGITFVLVGLLGFVPNPLVAHDGIFAVNAAHNAVHILTGGVFIFGALKFADRGSVIIKAVGYGYVAVAILGFFVKDGGMLLGLVHINQADKWLHAGLAFAILGAGFVVPDRRLIPAQAKA